MKVVILVLKSWPAPRSWIAVARGRAGRCRPSRPSADRKAAVGIAYPQVPQPPVGNTLGLLVVQAGQGDLFEVVAALHVPGGLAGGLHRRQQERDQNADDRDHHQQFHKGKGPPKS